MAAAKSRVIWAWIGGFESRNIFPMKDRLHDVGEDRGFTGCRIIWSVAIRADPSGLAENFTSPFAGNNVS